MQNVENRAAVFSPHRNHHQNAFEESTAGIEICLELKSSHVCVGSTNWTRIKAALSLLMWERNVGIEMMSKDSYTLCIENIRCKNMNPNHL